MLSRVAVSSIVTDDAAPSGSFGDEDMRTDWERAPDEVKYSIEQAVNHGTPALSVAFYARWWQLEPGCDSSSTSSSSTARRILSPCLEFGDR